MSLTSNFKFLELMMYGDFDMKYTAGIFMGPKITNAKLAKILAPVFQKKMPEVKVELDGTELIIRLDKTSFDSQKKVERLFTQAMKSVGFSKIKTAGVVVSD